MVEKLKLTQTEKDGLYVGIKKDGRKYSVRKDRSRYFYPDEWNNFYKSLREKNRFLFFTLIETGARIDEALNIRAKDVIADSRKITLYVTKSKAKKGETAEMGGKPRAFSISSDYAKAFRKYIRENNIDEFSDVALFTESQQAVYQMLKRKLKELKMDYWNFSLHNIRKTHGMWLKTLQSRGKDLDISEICMRLGHDYNTFLKHYGSPSIFGDSDRDKMVEILGDIYGLH